MSKISQLTSASNPVLWGSKAHAAFALATLLPGVSRDQEKFIGKVWGRKREFSAAGTAPQSEGSIQEHGMLGDMSISLA